MADLGRIHCGGRALTLGYEAVGRTQAEQTLGHEYSDQPGICRWSHRGAYPLGYASNRAAPQTVRVVGTSVSADAGARSAGLRERRRR